MKYLNFSNRIGQGKGFEKTLSLIDCSGSMYTNDWKPSRIVGAINANIELIKKKAQYYPDDIFGAIGFGDKAILTQEPIRLAGNIENICEQIKRSYGLGGTNFVNALILAENCFVNENIPRDSVESNGLLGAITAFFYESGAVSTGTSTINDGVTKRIIMLTDGEHLKGGDPLVVSDRLKQSGVIIDCIGIGGTPANVNESLLKRIASTNPDGSVRYCFIGDQDQLIKKYESLATHIRPA